MSFHKSKRPLTDNDRAILGLLRLDARRTVSEIAAQIGVSRTTVKERIETMRERGVIRGFTLEMGDSIEIPDSFTRGFFQVQLKRPVCKLVHAAIAGWPELIGFWSLAGELDAMVLVVAPTPGDIETLRERLSRLSDVKSLTTLLVLKEWSYRGTPDNKAFLSAVK
jgi:Lrp/AsnC family leucine-responsive transcriptional regulator